VLNNAGSAPLLRRARRAAVSAAVLAVASVTVTACGSSGGSGTTGGGTGGTKPVLNVGLKDGSGINPATTPSGASQLESLAYAAITHLRPDGSIAPGLAASWHYVGTGNREFTFTLRSDARFSDGMPVTASAVKTWLDYFVKAKGPAATNIPIASITTSGTRTVTLHLSAPNPIVPYLLSEVLNIGYVASPSAVAHPATLGTRTAGAGPYMLAPGQSVSGNQYVFVPNKHFYDQSAIHYSKVVVKVITEPSTMLEAAKTGQLDVAYGDITTADSAQSAGLDVVSAPSAWVGIAILNHGAKLSSGSPNPLANAKVRQALNYALDRKTITQAIVGKYGTPTSEAATTDGDDAASNGYYSYDPAKAKALLAAAGYANGLTLAVVSQSYIGTLGDPVVQAMAKYLAAVGVKLQVTRAAAAGQYLPKVQSGTFAGTGISESPLLPMYQFYSYFLAPKAFFNQGGWSDPAIDKLWQEGSAADAATAASNWKAITDRTTAQALELPVFKANALWYASKKVGGVAFSGASGAPYPTEWFPKS